MRYQPFSEAAAEPHRLFHIRDAPGIDEDLSVWDTHRCLGSREHVLKNLLTSKHIGQPGSHAVLGRGEKESKKGGK